MKLDRLPPHITGFFDKDEQQRSLDGATFKQACYLVAQTCAGTVERVDLNLVGRNFLGATIRTNADCVSVLCNSVYPYLAFVPPNAFGLGFPELTFVEADHLAGAFTSATNFHPLDADWLQKDISSEVLNELVSTERRELEYWKPQRVGDVVFNAWD